MHRLPSRVLKSPIPIALFLALAAALSGACQSMVLEPMDESSVYQSSVKFWGYSVYPGEPVRLEAQNSTSTWELLTTANSMSTPTHTAGRSGYYYELWYYAPSIPTRFRRTSPYASQGYWRSNFRVIVNGSVAETRQHQPNGTQVTASSWFEEFWFEHTTANSTLRLDIHP